MRKTKLTVKSTELQTGDVIVYAGTVQKSSDSPQGTVQWMDIERDEPYKQGTILLIKTGNSVEHGPGYTLQQVAERIGIGSFRGRSGSWLSTRGEGKYLSDADIEMIIAKSGGVEVLREGTGL